MSNAASRAAAAAIAPGPATLMGLHLALMDRLGEIVEPLWGMDTKTATRSPTVRDGYLPPKVNSAGYTPNEEFPFVIVSPRSGIDSAEAGDENARATFELSLGAYSDDDDGWHQLLLLIDAIRDSLESEPNVGGAFEHTGPLEWALPDTQPRPQWHALISTTFRLPRPQRIEDRDPITEE